MKKRNTNAATYIILQGIKAVGLVLAISMVCFFLVSISPVDPVRSYVGEVGMNNMSKETLRQLNDYFGVSIPIWKRYLNWLSGLVRGDMGMSLIYRRPVAEVITSKFMNTFALMVTAWVLSGIFGFLLGIAAGLFRGRRIDQIIQGYCLILASSPPFWIALILLMVFAVWLHILPVGLSVPIGVNAENVTFRDMVTHLILPATTLSLVGVANIALHMREKMIDVMESDYVLYARARGDHTWQIVKKHGLRNILLPAITLQFASISEIFGGSVLVEQVFSYPGLGNAAVSAGLAGDVPMLLGLAIISALFVFFGNLMANILYGVVDPRIRRG